MDVILSTEPQPKDCVVKDLHWAAKGKILLVGEGNFTFTKALLNQVSGSQLVTSCYQSEAILRDKFPETLKIIDELQVQGVEVLYEVDATCLETHNYFQKTRAFDRIYFNFPHVGGKTKIKLNRALIKNFFISAERHLAPNGEICVALCRGQGGTPADEPCRQWHDSWQVAAMATHSNLVLSTLVRFDKELFPGYQPTGFRGRNQWFHTEGGLIHVFTRSTLLRDDQWLPDPVLVSLGTDKRLVSSYIARKMSRDLTSTENHPIMWLNTWLQNSLSAVVSQSCSHLRVPSPLVSSACDSWLCYPAPLTRQEEAGASNTTLERLDIVVDRSNDDVCCLKELHFDVSHESGGQGGFSYILHRQTDSHDISKLRWRHQDDSKSFLRPSLLCSLNPEMLVIDRLNIVSGPVFRRVPLSPQQHDLPVSHELLFLSNDQSLSNLLCEILCAVNIDVTCEQLNFDLDENNHFDTLNWLQELNSVVKVAECDLNEVWFAKSNHHTHPRRLIAYTGCYKMNELNVSYISLCLDAITTCAFALPSDHLLWSEDSRLFSQLGSISLDAALVSAKIPVFKPWSLYSRPWPCDMSFWLPDGVTLDTFDYHSFIDLIRDVCDDIVTSVQLLESYVCDGRVSLCYRLFFHSYDQARSYSLTWQTQARLRVALEALFCVTLR